MNWVDPTGNAGRKKTARNVAVKKLRQLMKDPDAETNEQCFSVCEREGEGPFTTPTIFGTSQDCPIASCPPKSLRVLICHVHPRQVGPPGHSTQGGGDTSVSQSLGVPSMVGFDGNIWEYDPRTNTETHVCCRT